MLTIRKLSFLFLLLILTTAGFSQSKLAVAPVPSDPFELVTGATHVPSTPQERTEILELLEHARQNGDLQAAGSAPFSIKVSFNAAGNVHLTGTGNMEETWFGSYSFRWSASLGNFSMTRIAARGRLFDDRPLEFIPMRVHMLRGAIFWPINFDQAHALIRTAAANWKGKDLTCILTSGGMSDPTATPGRRWVEREFCVETRTGLLQILSDAPGIYTLYDYDDALKFHGRMLPRQVSIVEGSKTVLTARLESITDATGFADSFVPSEDMRNTRPGPLLGGAIRFPHVVRVAPGAAIVQPVMVHAIVDHNGKVKEAEVLDDSGAALNQSALDLVKNGTYRIQNPKEVNRQREAFINVQFISE